MDTNVNFRDANEYRLAALLNPNAYGIETQENYKKERDTRYQKRRKSSILSFEHNYSNMVSIISFIIYCIIAALLIIKVS